MLESLHGGHFILYCSDLSRTEANCLDFFHCNELTNLRSRTPYRQVRRTPHNIHTHTKKINSSLSLVGCNLKPNAKCAIDFLTSSPASGCAFVSLALCTVLLPPFPTTFRSSHDHAC